MALNSKSEICNLALSNLGNYGTVSDIDTPTNQKEITFAIWYDVTRQSLLKNVMPNFSLGRVKVAKLVETPAFGYGYYYEYPSYCLKVLGIGDVPDRRNDYSIEVTPSGVTAIATDQDYSGGLELRYIRDITDVTQMTSDFKLLFAKQLAANVCLDITQDAAKAAQLQKIVILMLSSVSGLNAQENRPIRISNSRFQEARWNDFPNATEKK